jgi:hypothetical protein
MTDENTPETAKAAPEPRDTAGTEAYEAARFDGLCEEGAAEVAAEAARARRTDAENAAQTEDE